MSERWCHAYVIGASPETLLPDLQAAALPVGVRLAQAPGGTRLLFGGLAPEIGRYLQGLHWPAWVETEDSIADARRLTLLRDGQVEYEESLDPEGRAHVIHGGVRRSCDAARITPRVSAHARAAMQALARRGLQVLPERRIWEGEPFPDAGTAEVVATLPASLPEEEQGEIPF